LREKLSTICKNKPKKQKTKNPKNQKQKTKKKPKNRKLYTVINTQRGCYTLKLVYHFYYPTNALNYIKLRD